MCELCQVISIQGQACHETGCPDSWRHPLTGDPLPVECFECGCDYVPEVRVSHPIHAICPDCIRDRNFDAGGYCEDCGLPLDECGQCSSYLAGESCSALVGPSA